MVFIVKENTQSLGHELCNVLQNPLFRQKPLIGQKTLIGQNSYSKKTLFKPYSKIIPTKPLVGQNRYSDKNL